MPTIPKRTPSQGELALLKRLQTIEAKRQLRIRNNRHSLFDRRTDSLSKADNDI